ncbi:hypothetical protein IWW36_001477 [Coemansia brasiliensis]|uniref:Eukaryotic translation initiation factor 3 subunit D n=1 Tax=Coemansia brasiliensis TaxID=2650707 RepID=A0A9W8IFB1_9FUNG|nr:hypothetical protein IWW36_001477 [Coemansia brasiliensis]
MSDLPSFSLPEIFDNPKGWGPSSAQPPAAAFKDIPYVLYSKGDKVNRAANWINPQEQRDQRDGRNRGRYGRDFGQQTYGSNSSSAFVYQADEDESSFSLVDSRSTGAKQMAIRAVSRADTRGRGGGRGGRGMGMQRLGRGGARGGSVNAAQRKRYRWRDAERGQHHRYASVKPGEDWELVQDIEFSRMSGLSFLARDAGDLGRYGRAGIYDHSYDRTSTKLEKPLRNSGAVRYNVTASDDPVLQKVSEEQKDVHVFATDTVLATLMAATVSSSAWDVVVNRVGDKLFLDKRDGGPLDFPSVNENAANPPADSSDKEGSMNLAPMLAMEARDINRNYIRQVTSKGSVDYQPNLFNANNEEGDSVDDSAYRYRLLDFSARKLVSESDSDSDAEEEVIGDRCLVAVRTEISGLLPSGTNNEPKQLFIRALTQHDITAAGAGDALDWRQKLDSQRGAVIATEMKNNSSKLARWAFQALLADADQMRIGFVSRVSPRDRTRHGVLGHQTYNPSDFVGQLGLNEFNAWGILKAIIDLCLKLDEGKYVIMRDPNKPLIMLYKVPQSAFDDDNDDKTDAAMSVAGGEA